MKRQQIDALFVYREHETSGLATFHIDALFSNFRPGTTIIFTWGGELVQLVRFSLDIMDHLGGTKMECSYGSPRRIFAFVAAFPR